MKDKIQHDLQQPEGPLRLLLATEAYGMGADCPNIRNVVHIGPPNTIESKYGIHSTKANNSIRSAEWGKWTFKDAILSFWY